MTEIDATDISRARAELEDRGATCVRGAFDPHWLEVVRRGLDECVAAPSRFAKTWEGEHSKGRFFQDGFAWERFAPLRNFVFDSPAASLVSRLMGSEHVHIYMDHLLMRDPNTDKATPWHHDTPYCFVEGSQFCTIWLPLDPIALGEGLRLVSGSHRWGKMFLPVEFGSNAAYARLESAGAFDYVPDVDATPDKYDILSWDVQLGDCIVFYCSMLHAAPPHNRAQGMRRVYSTRWVGDDARYTLRGWSVPPLPRDPGLKPGDAFGGDLFPRIV